MFKSTEKKCIRNSQLFHRPFSFNLLNRFNNDYLVTSKKMITWECQLVKWGEKQHGNVITVKSGKGMKEAKFI